VLIMPGGAHPGNRNSSTARPQGSSCKDASLLRYKLMILMAFLCECCRCQASPFRQEVRRLQMPSCEGAERHIQCVFLYQIQVVSDATLQISEGGETCNPPYIQVACLWLCRRSDVLIRSRRGPCGESRHNFWRVHSNGLLQDVAPIVDSFRERSH
jgi:hypothetical protein